MRFITLNELEENMIAVKPVYDLNGVLLIARNKVITKENILSLFRLHYSGIYIYDGLEDENELNEVIREDTRQEAILNFKNLNIDAVTYLANQIVENVNRNPNIILDLTEIRNYHTYTYHHSLNVSYYSTVVGVGMGLTNAQLIELSIAGILHDIGKMQITKLILDKPSSLSKEEYLYIKEHSLYGYNLLKDNKKISTVIKDAILHHHENVDGTGYPYGLIGNDIPLFSKIIHVVDVYDALINQRVYKEAYSPNETIEYLMGNCGIMFEEKIVRMFCKYIAVYPKGIKVRLSNGKIGVVYKNYIDSLLRPSVKLEDGLILELKDDYHLLNITIEDIIK